MNVKEAEYRARRSTAPSAADFLELLDLARRLATAADAVEGAVDEACWVFYAKPFRLALAEAREAGLLPRGLFWE